MAILKVGVVTPNDEVRHMSYGVNRRQAVNIEIVGVPRGTWASVAIINERNTLTKCRGSAQW